MKSIMQKKDGTCYLCQKLHGDSARKIVVQEHHCIHGTSNRKNSTKYGLLIYLCNEHHIYGSEAVHANPLMNLKVKKEAQEAFEKKYPDLDFIKIFGKSYL